MQTQQPDKMRILVSGSSGMIGRALITALRHDGAEVIRLLRGDARDQDVRWDPGQGTIDTDRLTGFDVVIHLAGENIAAGRWTAARKTRIVESRERGTRLLAESLAARSSRPRMLLTASAVGIYGDRGEEVLIENSLPGSGFLADVCRRWEAAAQPAQDAGIRTLNLRFGVVLSVEGGMLGKLLTPFRFGLGGIVGSGRQYVSWISISDAVDAIRFLLRSKGLQGPVNVVSPKPVTNREFTRTLGRVLGRPTVLPVPGVIVRALFGEMGDELLLASQRSEPSALLSAGFQFQHPDLGTALRSLLNR
jgi:uncharacterized protein (TIGR01777 family)